MPNDPDVKPSAMPFWSRPLDSILTELRCGTDGLGERDAADRLRQQRANSLQPTRRAGWPVLLLKQFKTPIVLILLAAAALSFFLRDSTDAGIIIVIILISGFLGFWQEKSAADAVAGLLALVQVKSTARRDGCAREIPVAEIVPGDVVQLSAGDFVPGDGRILAAKDLFVDEASLTGETFPLEKSPAPIPPGATMSQRTNSLFLGTHVVSGTARLLVIHTGKATEFGRISETLKQRPSETEFERGVRRFGYFLLEVTLLLAIGIFALNAYFGRPVLDSLLFTLALAVGLTPQLLPAIISVNLARGAKRMAAQQVIVKRLAAIENFGSMTVLCSDKTGTLTEGRPEVTAAIDATGEPSAKALAYAALNARFQTGYVNPMDPAIIAHALSDPTDWLKLDEVPYDFSRRRMSVLLGNGQVRLLVTKGALPNIMTVCSQAELNNGARVDIATVRDAVSEQLRALSDRGQRVLGVAYRLMGAEDSISKEQESGMTFLGLVAFADPLRPDIAQTLQALRATGITLKVVTGDHHLIALDVSRRAGLGSEPRWLTGGDLRKISPEALVRRVNDVDVFAEVEPDQKERIILALRKSGQVVGYIGDGINDASALHAADVSISVADAADVAKKAADIVLLEKNLAVLERGVSEGRATFANTMKYVFMATSANFGNMFSMAGASLFLPFLPLLPKQILLMNLLTDLPEMTIATDRVDEEWTRWPRRWNLQFIQRFMITFGLLSSLFDYATFAVLWFWLRVPATQFRSAWLVESVVSAALIVLVVRTMRPAWRSRPGRGLFWATILVCAIALALPYAPGAALLGLTPLPASLLAILLFIVALYVVAAELAKRMFYRLMPPG